MTKEEWIYDMMNGALVGNALLLPREDILVTSEFNTGMYCETQYKQVFYAKLRIEERMGSDEDDDTEAIINCMNDIIRYLALKMYGYGKDRISEKCFWAAFQNETYCRELYRQVLDAKTSLNIRLGTRDDTDVNIMIDGMANIMNHFTKKIYEYGREAAKR